MKTTTWEHRDLRVEGLSLAGTRTSLAVPAYSLAFDVAQGLPHAFGMQNFFISHGHMDHAAGIPYVISQKAMHSHKSPCLYMPESMVDPMYEIMKQWSKIENFQYEFEFIGLAPGDEISLGRGALVRAFETVHRIPSLGYSIVRTVRKLKKELVGKTPDELSELRRRGGDPMEEHQEIVMSFTGDTQIEFLDRSPDVKNSKVLFMEATYLDAKKSVASAREWGHTHLDELIPRLPEIKSEKILLIHSSARYPMEEAKAMLAKRLPAHERERVVLFEGR